MLDELKQKSSKEHREMIRGLVSFNFPSTQTSNQANINLKHYQKYFKHQMHLAPSTDQRMAFMTMQEGFGNRDKSTGIDTGVENYQELGCVGFYGIQSNDETMIAMLLMTNCQDVSEAYKLRKRSKSGFNNIQQQLVPDLQMNLLKRALKKIIQHLMKNHKAR